MLSYKKQKGISGGQSISRRSNLVVPEYNSNEGERPEEVHTLILSGKNDYQLDRSDYRQMEYDNNGSFTNDT